MPITHINFYSGSGMWEKEAAALGWHKLASCENNRYARQLLEKRFQHDIIPNATGADARQYRDIADVITFSPPLPAQQHRRKTPRSRRSSRRTANLPTNTGRITTGMGSH